MILFYLYPIVAIIPATVVDIRTMRIPNAITFPLMSLGIAATAIFNTANLSQCIIAMAALFLFGATGLVGLGDIKLLMVVASTCGIMFTIVTIGIAAITLLVKELITDYKQTRGYIAQGLFMIVRCNMSMIDRGGKKVPMAIYILIGYACAFAGRFILHAY